MKTLNYNKELIFGEKYASISNNINFVASQISKIVPSLKYIDPVGSSYDFLGKNYSVNLNGLRLSANYISPTQVYAQESNEYTFMFPIKGSCSVTVENKNYIWSENNFAYFKPKCEGKSISKSGKNSLFIDLSPERFNEQARIMLGEKEKKVFFNFEKPHLIPIKHGNLSFDLIIKQLSKIIDSNINSIQKLEKIKFDEIIYRTLIIMFLAEYFFKDRIESSKKVKISTSTLTLVKELQHEHYFSFMSLSDLENFLGLSTRNLQLVFKKFFDITPIQFLREQKLKYAKKMILESRNTLNISKIANEVGFVNFSSFAKYYKEYHHELPSQSLKALKVKYYLS